MRLKLALRQRHFIRTQHATVFWCILCDRILCHVVHTVSDNCRSAQNRVLVLNMLEEEESFYQQIGLKFEEETSEVLRLEHDSVWC